MTRGEVGQGKLVSARFLRALLDAGERVGVDRAAALAAVGVRPEEAADANGWIPAARMTRAWEVVPELSGDPSFGLHAAEQAPAGVYGPLDLATMSSATVGEAFDRVERYYAAMGAMSELRAKRGPGGELTLTVRTVVRARTDLRHFVEHMLALFVTRARATVALPAAASPADARVASAIEVRFAHAAPADTREHARILGPHVRFGARASEIVLSRELVSLPLRTANPELAPILEREEARLRLRPDAPVTQRVRGAIEQGLRDGRVDLEAVAKRLGMGPRTVQRLLQRDGTSFAEVLDAFRREAALRAVEEGATALSELAYSLGFAQPSALYRAFKRWTGTTPAAYRDRAR